MQRAVGQQVRQFELRGRADGGISRGIVELLDPSGELISCFDWPWSPDLPEELRRRIRA